VARQVRDGQRCLVLVLDTGFVPARRHGSMKLLDAVAKLRKMRDANLRQTVLMPGVAECDKPLREAIAC
jgi:hypothetical protein